MKIGDGSYFQNTSITKFLKNAAENINDVLVEEARQDSFFSDSTKTDKANSHHHRNKTGNQLIKDGTNEDIPSVSFSEKNIKRYTTKSSLQMDGYMIPANEGHIRHMCLTYSGGVENNYFEAMKTMISKMPSAKFTVLTESDSVKNTVLEKMDNWVQEGVIKNHDNVNLVNIGENLSVWAQDSTLVVGNNVIEQDRKWFPANGDGFVAFEVVNANPELKYKKLDGIFVDGGNQLATMDTLFIGSDAIAFMLENMREYPSKYDNIRKRLHINNKTAANLSSEELCKLMLDKTFPRQKVEIIGYMGRQPSFHIDMTMTPLGKTDPETGKKVITVGDPSLAVSILESIKEKQPEEYEKYADKINEKIGVTFEKITKWMNKKFPKLSEKLGIDDNPLDKMIKLNNEDGELQENLDAVSKGLQDDGYKVVRVPYLGFSDLNDAPWITYNNSVIDGDNIFIPNFDIPELDNYANDIYRKYGYNPVPIDMTKISSLKGAINCITKVVEREYNEA